MSGISVLIRRDTKQMISLLHGRIHQEDGMCKPEEGSQQESKWLSPWFGLPGLSEL